MKRMVAALMLVMTTALAGCSDGPHVDKGGGERVVLEQDANRHLTGRVDVQGHVVNSGGRKAKDVSLQFTFFQGGTLYLEGEVQLGDIDAGDSRSFSATFYGPPVTVTPFTWDYRIEWD